MSSKIEERQPDLRVRRTRMMIEKAFIELLQERDFQSITVQHIADRAMVNRATFYDHFTDKYALFEHSVREWFRQTLQSKLPPDFTSCASIIPLLVINACEFVNQIDEHCRPINPQGLPSFDEHVVSLISEHLHRWMDEHAQPDTPHSPALIAEVASWAMYGAARQWRFHKHRESIDAFAARITPMILAIMQQGEGVAT